MPAADAIMKGTAIPKSTNDSITELRFVPENPEDLEKMFNIMADCQALHESDQPVAEGMEAMEDEEEYYEGEYDEAGAVEQFNGEPDSSHCCPGEEDMTPQGLATLKRLEACLSQGAEEGTHQFADAEPEAMTA